MKYLAFFLINAVLLGFWGGCSDSSSTNDPANVSVVSQMTSAVANMTVKGGNEIQAATIDSIKITSVRVLMTEMKLFGDDTTSAKLLKTGPFVYKVDSTGTLITLANNTVTPGTYKKIKFEFHRFSASEATQYASDAVLKDFADNNRYSVIITGYIYVNNTAEYFTFNASTTANVVLEFTPSLDLTSGSNTTLALQLAAEDVFKVNNTLLDPRESKNVNDIENAIKSALKAIKK